MSEVLAESEVETLAHQDHEVDEHTIMFRVSRSFLDQATDEHDLTTWMGPAHFQFMQQPDGTYDLIFRRVD